MRRHIEIDIEQNARKLFRSDIDGTVEISWRFLSIAEQLPREALVILICTPIRGLHKELVHIRPVRELRYEGHRNEAEEQPNSRKISTELLWQRVPWAAPEETFRVQRSRWSSLKNRKGNNENVQHADVIKKIGSIDDVEHGRRG
jgi:hypothetical protein